MSHNIAEVGVWQESLKHMEVKYRSINEEQLQKSFIGDGEETWILKVSGFSPDGQRWVRALWTEVEMQIKEGWGIMKCSGKFPLSSKAGGRRQWHPTPVLLPGKSHGQRSLVGCSPWGREESDMIERLPFHFSLSCIGEGNGNPLQYSCLENPKDRGI